MARRRSARQPAGDVELLLTLVQEFYALDFIAIAFDAAAARRALDELIGDPSLGRVWLIVVDGQTVGYIVFTFGFSLEYQGRDAMLDELFLRETQRGRGIGTAVLRLLEAEARALAVHAIHLEVSKTNIAAARLYAAAGFRPNETDFLTKWLVDR